MPPYSGAILAVDVDELDDDPAVLRWFDGNGERIAPADVAEHPVNDDFDGKVDVVAHGFRNVYGLAFDGDDVLHVAMNGSDDPAGPDAFYRLDELEDGEGVDYRYPYCFDEGDVGATGGDVGLRSNPAAPDHDCHVFEGIDSLDDPECDEDEHPTADAILGWHACAMGLDFPSEGRAASPDRFLTDAFVGECGTYSPLSSGERTLESTDGRNTGHSVAHVGIDGGDGSGVRDFLTGLSLPTDVHFGPRGGGDVRRGSGGRLPGPAGRVTAPRRPGGVGCDGVTLRLRVA